MAAVTVSTAATDTGYVDPIRGAFSGTQADTESILTVGTFSRDRHKWSTYLAYVSVAADADTLDCSAVLGIQGVKMAFWKGLSMNATVEDHVNVSVNGTDTLIFECAAAAQGYLLIFYVEEQPGRKGRRVL